MALLAAWSAAAIWFFHTQGSLVRFGDAEAHWNIARQVFDSQTPGYRLIGTVWLPFPHWLMLPLARVDVWWRNGLAASLPAAASFLVAGAFLFAAMRRQFDSVAAVAATAVFASNPNLLYLQSIAMTEVVFFACLMGLLYFTVRFRETQGWGAVAGAGIAAFLGALTRYEGWFLIPFVALYFLLRARKRRLAVAGLFSVLAALGPLYWLAHNWWYTGDWLDFYRGPYSAIAIQGSAAYPGRGNWHLAWLYFRTAAELCSGSVLWWIGWAGVAAALLKRAFWPMVLLALPGVFYLWSMHSAATPIFVPTLWPNSFYNTRYGTEVFPLLAAGTGGLVALLPRPARPAIAVLAILAVVGYWLVPLNPERWVTWKEAQVNSQSRLQWVREAAAYLGPRYVAGSGIFSASGEFRAVCRRMGIPLREELSVDNGFLWLATLRRPDLFLWQQWALAIEGDGVQKSLRAAEPSGIRYRLEKTIVVQGAPPVEIYRRVGGRHGPAGTRDDGIHQ